MKSFSVSAITVYFSERLILSDVGFTLGENSRVALVGRNGSGKTTLMKAALGLIDIDGGERSITKGARASYLAQSDILLKEKSLYDSAEEGYDWLKPLIDELEECESDISEKSIERAAAIRERLENTSYWERKWRIENILEGLGFEKSDFKRKANEFSSGYQMRIALSRMLISEPDFMFLDEPTNYLDIDSLTWLEGYLKTYKGGLMVVSHDQDFLDRTVKEVYEIERGKLTKYSGNYSDYERKKNERIKERERIRAREEQKIKETEEFIERFRYKATKAKQVQSRIKMLDKMERMESEEREESAIFSFPPAPPSGNEVIRLKDLTKSYDGKKNIFSSFSLDADKGDRIAVTGKNGIGKSTLLRILAKKDTLFSGTLKWGANIKLAYFTTDDEEYRDNQNTVIDELRSVGYISDEPRLRNMLGAFLFKGDDVFKRVSVLSGGERSRLSLVKILLHPSNLLILDEPTNHLDIPTKEILIKAIKNYQGTLIFSSHDKHFIKELADKIVYIDKDGPELFLGDYDYFEYKLEEKEKSHLTEERIEKKEPPQKKDRDLSKEIKNRIKSLERSTKDLEEKIKKKEAEIESLKASLEKSEVYSSADRGREVSEQIATGESALSSLMEEWIMKNEEIERWKES